MQIKQSEREKEKAQKSCRKSLSVQIFMSVFVLWMFLCTFLLCSSIFASRCGLQFLFPLSFYFLWGLFTNSRFVHLWLQVFSFDGHEIFPSFPLKWTYNTHIQFFWFFVFVDVLFLIHAAGHDIKPSFLCTMYILMIYWALNFFFLQCRLPWTNWCMPIKKFDFTSLLLLRFVSHIYHSTLCIVRLYVYVWAHVGVVHCILFVVCNL